MIVVTTTGGIRTAAGTATVMAGGQTSTQTVNVLPSTGQVTTGPGGVKMIVVSQGVASSSSSTTASTTTVASGTKTISIPAGALQKTLPGGQTLVGSGQQTITIGGKPVTVQVSTAGGQKTVTLVTNPGSSTYN